MHVIRTHIIQAVVTLSSSKPPSKMSNGIFCGTTSKLERIIYETKPHALHGGCVLDKAPLFESRVHEVESELPDTIN